MFTWTAWSDSEERYSHPNYIPNNRFTCTAALGIGLAIFFFVNQQVLCKHIVQHHSKVVEPWKSFLFFSLNIHPAREHQPFCLALFVWFWFLFLSLQWSFWQRFPCTSSHNGWKWEMRLFIHFYSSVCKKIVSQLSKCWIKCTNGFLLGSRFIPNRFVGWYIPHILTQSLLAVYVNTHECLARLGFIDKFMLYMLQKNPKKQSQC